MRLQQQNQLLSEVTAEHMIELLDEASKNTLRVQSVTDTNTYMYIVQL